MTRSPESRSLVAEILAALTASLLLGVVAVYLPMGLAAAAALDQAGPWQEALGTTPPLRYRAFVALREWTLPLSGIVLAAIAVHGAVRRYFRRTRSFGDDLVWDGVTSPAATGALAMVVGTAVFAAAERRWPTGDGLAAVATAAAGLAVALGLVGSSVGLVRRSPLARRAVTVLVALLVLAPLARVAADAWGGARLHALARSLEPALEAERRRRSTERRPVLRGPVLEEDAAPRYRSLMSRLAEDPPHRDALSAAVVAGPGSPLSPEALALLDRRRDLVAGTREAVRCTRCVWELKPLAPNETVPSLLPARNLASLLVLEGHERAQSGDRQGAAERYLDAVRLGSDFAEGSLISNLIGISAATTGIDALGHLLVSERRPPLTQVGAELARLEGRLPTVATSLREQRFQVVGGLELARRPEDVFAVPPILPAIVPYRLLTAQAAEAAERRLWQWEREAADGGGGGQTRPDTAVEDGPLWNPAYRVVSPAHTPRIRVSANDLAARFALARSAVAVEEAAGRDRRHAAPTSLPPLPVDPWAPPQPIRYEPSADGTGYRLWSVGMNRADDGGTTRESLDLVLERLPR